MTSQFKERLLTFLRWSEKYTKTDMVYLFSGGALLFIGQLLASAASFFLAVVFANFLPPETYGIYKYIIATTGLIGAFSLTGLGFAIIRSVSRGSDSIYKNSFSQNMRWSVGVIAIGLSFAFYYLLQGNTPLALALGIGTIGTPILAGLVFYNPYLTGKKQFKTFTKFWIIYAIVPAIALGTTVYFSNSLLLIIAVYFVSHIVVAWILNKKTNHLFPPNNEKDPQALSHAKHMSIISLFGLVAFHVDKLLVFQYLGAAQLALYAFAVAIPEQLRGVFKNINSLALPRFSVRSQEEIESSIISKIFFTGGISLMLVFLYIGVAPYIYGIFFPSYIAAIPYSQLFALSLVGAAAALPTAAIQAQANNKKLYTFNIAAAVVRILCMIAGVQFGGMLGLIVGRIAAEWLMVGVSYKVLTLRV